MKRLILILLAILISVSCYYPGRHMTDWGHMYYGYGGLLMWLILLVFIALVIFFIFSSKKYVKRDEGETALEILKKRYAKGEISKQEFEKMKKDLE